MVEVIPAILEHDFAGVQKKAKLIATFSDVAQLDVMDGQFVPNTTFSDASKIAELPLKLEVHLMVVRPELHLMQWNIPNVFRIIVHAEAVSNVRVAVEMIQKMGKEAAVAINPQTPVRDIADIVPDLDMVLVMGVEPGFSGQKFQYDVIEKIKELKSEFPDIRVAVDGGVNAYTAKHILAAGADILSGSSAIFSADDPAVAFKNLQLTEPSERPARR